jgi:hypothetical protein
MTGVLGFSRISPLPSRPGFERRYSRIYVISLLSSGARFERCGTCRSGVTQICQGTRMAGKLRMSRGPLQSNGKAQDANGCHQNDRPRKGVQLRLSMLHEHLHTTVARAR